MGYVELFCYYGSMIWYFLEIICCLYMCVYFFEYKIVYLWYCLIYVCLLIVDKLFWVNVLGIL